MFKHPSLILVTALAFAIPVAGAPPDRLGDSSVNGWEVAEELRMPTDDILGDEIASLVSHLGAPSFSTRSLATDRLIKIGAPALAQLRDKYERSEDLETRLRIETIAHTSYLNYHVFDRHGFLGVQLWVYTPGRNLPAKVPEGTAGVVVQSVIRGTGAAASGLMRDDVIIAVDDQPLDGTKGQLVQNFAKLIRLHRPGTSMRLTVLRGSGETQIVAIVGRCPEAQIRNGRVNTIPTLLRKADARFPIWWNRHFGQKRELGSSVGTTTPK